MGSREKRPCKPSCTLLVSFHSVLNLLSSQTDAPPRTLRTLLYTPASNPYIACLDPADSSLHGVVRRSGTSWQRKDACRIGK
ncbi:hypothetical protein K469DRAFT_703836 [Zopfia rhizophila CBS 207.26]|uniref:Uncharacterized protein n=1 Tax=Zopfia rhizophila CBS 207.26 TaxID=1314779 RepID=A0A6A6E8N0_9PEZI|nr:hypothetical protein K469DRAFT_703836 [Zopfia rhizophila CBS 207.26]